MENQRGGNSPRDAELRATGTALGTEPLTPGRPPAATRAIAGRSERCAPHPRSGAMNGPHSQPAVFIDPRARPRAARTTSPLCAGTRCAHSRQRVRAAPVRGGRERRVTASGMWGQGQPGAELGRTGEDRKASSQALLGRPGPIPHPVLSSSVCSPTHGAAIRHGRATAAAAHAAARPAVSSKSPPPGWGRWNDWPHREPVPQLQLICVLKGGSH